MLAFEKFYYLKLPGKVLIWQIEASICEIYGHFTEKV